MALDPAIQIGTGRGNAVISPQAGLYIQPTAPTGSSGSILNIGPSGQIPTYPGADPTITGVYLVGIVDVPGSATAYNFYALWNPVSSTKTVVVEGVTVDNYITGTVTSAPSLLVYKINSAPTGGTLISGSAINKFFSGFPNSQAQVYTTNPTVVTTGLQLIGFPPALGAGNSGAVQSASPTPGASFVLLPGQGVVFSTSSGSTSQMWNIQVIWAEK